MTIGGKAIFGRRLVIEHQGAIVAHVQPSSAMIVSFAKGLPRGNQHLDRPNKPPRLGNRVNVGAGAKILGGVSIGGDEVYWRKCCGAV